MNKTRIFFLLLLALLVLGNNGVLFEIFAAQTSKPLDITITSGPIGGGFYVVAGGIAEAIERNIPNSKVTVMTGGSVGNTSRVNEGTADIGITMDGVFLSAVEGIDPYEEKHANLQGLIFFGGIPMAWCLVNEDLPINSIDELKEKSFPIELGTSTPLSSPELATRRVLEDYGITYDDIRSWGGKVTFGSYADVTNLIKDGHLHAWMGPLFGTPAIEELVLTYKVKLLPVKEEVIDALKRYGYSKMIIEKGTYYFVNENTPFLAEKMILVVRKDLSDDIVYEITKIICENPEAIRGAGGLYALYNPTQSYDIVGGPIHPGAEKYFKEVGYIK